MCYDISLSVKGEKLSDYFPVLKIDPQFATSSEPRLHILCEGIFNWFRSKQCLIPATGIFNYHDVPGLKNKIPT